MTELILNNKVKAQNSHSLRCFTHYLCTENECCEFGVSYKRIYPKELVLKIEHKDFCAYFLNFNINIADGEFIYQIYDENDSFPFFLVRMLQLDSNIPNNIFNLAFF